MLDPIGVHIALRVRDLARAVNFYTSLFGLRVRGRGSSDEGPLVLLERGALRLALIESRTPGWEATRGGLHHLGFLVGSAEDVIAVEAALRRRGVPILRQVVNPRHPRERSIYVHDPDGHLIEVYCEAAQ